MLKIVVRQVPLKMTPNFQRQHYLYWCNVYNLSQGIMRHSLTPPFEFLGKDSKK